VNLILTWLRANWPAVLLVGILVYSSVALYGRGHRIGYELGVAEWKGKYEEKATELATAKAQYEHDQRQEETRRQTEIDKIRNETQAEVQQANADARDADAVSKRLQQQLDRMGSAYRNASKNSGTAAGGQTAACPVGVLTDLLRQSDERAGILARIADQARAAGSACERSYDSIRNNQ